MFLKSVETGFGTHEASNSMVIRLYFSGEMQPGCEVCHSTPSRVDVNKE
jgi:hypothetical protein